MIINNILDLTDETENVQINEMVITGTVIALGALAGSITYLLKKYLNSVSRLEKKIEKLKLQLQTEQDEDKLELLETRLKYFEEKLKISQSKLKSEFYDYVGKTKRLEIKYSKALSQRNTSAQYLSNLKTKIDKRRAIINRIGPNI